MLRSNLVGTMLAVAALAPGAARAVEGWEPVEAPVVTLISAGEGLLRPLRYQLAAADWPISRRHGYEAAIKFPIRGTQVDEGTVSLDFAGWPVEPTGDAPIEVAVELSQAKGRQGLVERLAGASGRVRFTDRGLPVAAAWDLHPVEADGEGLADRVLLDRFRTRASNLPTPLPEEPVGDGARWEIRQTLGQGGSSFTMIAVCTLLEETGDGLDLQCRFSHDAAATTFAVGTGSRPRAVELLESEVVGQSLILQRLDVLVPIREDGSLRTFLKARTRIGIAKVKVEVNSEESWSQVVRGVSAQ